MKVKDLKKLLEGKNDDAEVLIWEWHGWGSETHAAGVAHSSFEDPDVILLKSHSIDNPRVQATDPANGNEVVIDRYVHPSVVGATKYWIEYYGDEVQIVQDDDD